MSLKQGVAKLKSGGGRFVFEFFLELYYDDIIKAFREYLEDYTPDDIIKMIKEMRFPATDKFDLGEAQGYIDHIKRITPLRFMEAIAAARPDLAEAIQAQGASGAQYIVRLRAHFINLIVNPGQAMAKSKDYASGKGGKTVLATCSECHNSYPVPADQVDNPPECPFCKRAKTGQPAPEPEED